MEKTKSTIMRVLFYVLFIAVFIAQGCVIETKYNFNEDRSGNVYIEMDYSGFQEFGGAESSGNAMKDSTEKYKDDFTQLLESSGYTNVQISTEEEGKAIASYDFSSYELLNQSLENKNSKKMENNFAGMHFFTFDWSNKNQLVLKPQKNSGMEEMTEEEKTQLSFVNTMLELKYILSFQREISSIEGPFAFKKELKSVELRPLVSEISEFMDKNQKVKINFK